MSSIFNTATSALLANQRALATTGHNISNANTEGYSRQSVDFDTRDPMRTGAGFVGRGVDVDGIRRAYDQFVNDSLTAATAGQSKQNELASLSTEVDDLLGATDSGLTPALNEFFGSLQDVANDPTSTAARTAALGQAESLTSRFGQLDARFSELADRVQGRIENTVTEINDAAQSLADLNGEIAVAGGGTNGQQPNDLLDQRDRLVNRMAELVGVSTRERDDGRVDVFVGQGQPLVLGTDASAMSTADTRTDPGAPQVTLAGASGTVDLGNHVSGGRLDALVEFGSRVLDPARNALGRVAHGLTSAINDVHGRGLDLDGDFGGAFFDPVAGSARIAAASANTGSASMSARVTDASALTTSDYRLTREGANYTVERLSDGQTSDVSGALSGGGPATVDVDGVEISLDSGTIADGDRFEIQPTRNAAGAMSVALSDGGDIAAAGPVRSSAATGNTGSGEITQPSVGSTTNLPLSANGGPIELTFNAGANEFTVSGGPSGTLAYDPSTDANGRSYNFPGYGDMSFTVSGVPADGDRLMITDNTNGQGDNRNALALAGIAQDGVLEGGDATVNEAYGSLVADVASRTNAAQEAESVQGARLDAARSRRESVAGVNLDEEAANLMRYQQAYQASARVVTVANELFDTLLQAVGR